MTEYLFGPSGEPGMGVGAAVIPRQSRGIARRDDDDCRAVAGGPDGWTGDVPAPSRRCLVSHFILWNGSDVFY